MARACQSRGACHPHIVCLTRDLQYDDLYVLRDAWDRWGADAQIDVAIEEMAELTHAFLHGRRGGVMWTRNVIEEMADVILCLQQIEAQMRAASPAVWHEVEEIHAAKLGRLACRLDDERAAGQHAGKIEAREVSDE